MDPVGVANAGTPLYFGGMSPPFRDVTVGRLLTQLAAALPSREALVYADRGLRWTFRDLEAEARLIARGLSAPASLAAIVSRSGRPTSRNGSSCSSRSPRSARSSSPSTRRCARREIEYLLRQSETTTLFTIAGFSGVDYMAEFRESGANVPRVFFIGDQCPPDATPYAQLRTLAASVSDADLDRREQEVAVDDVINMQYTSGTTGFPKGVMLSSRNIVNNGYWIGEGLGYTPADRLCLCVPLFHCFGCVLGVLAVVHARRLPVSDRCLRSTQGARDRRSRTVHGHLRRADDVSRGTRASGVRSLQHVNAADRHHGRRVVPRAADAPRHPRDARAAS